MARRAGAGSAVKVVMCIVLLLVLVAGLLFVAYYTNGFTGGFRSFYVQIGDTKILKNTATVQLMRRVENRIDCKYTFGWVNRDIKGFTVQVIPNTDAGKDFDFTVNGEAYAYSAETDLSPGFDLQLYDDHFTIRLDTDMQGILQAVYPDAAVTVPDGLAWEDGYIVILVSSFDDAATVRLVVRWSVNVEDVVIDPGEVIL